MVTFLYHAICIYYTIVPQQYYIVREIIAKISDTVRNKLTGCKAIWVFNE